MGIVLISGESPSVSADDHGRIIHKGLLLLLLVLCCGDVWLLLLVMMMMLWLLLRKLLDVVDVAVALDVP